MPADPARQATREDWLAAVRAEIGGRDPASLDTPVDDRVTLRALGTPADRPAHATAAWPLPSEPPRLARIVRGPPRAADLAAFEGFGALRFAGGGLEAALGSGDATLVRGLDPASAVVTLTPAASGVRALVALHRLNLDHKVVLDVFDRIEGASPARGLAFALAAAVEVLRGCVVEGLSAAAVLARMYLPITLDTDVVTGIAKVRAARWLWHRVVAACTGSDDAPARIWARAAPACFSAIDPEINLVRGSLIAFVATAAGCDVLEPLLFEPVADRDEAQRLAANQLRILTDEAHLLRARDPAAGSFASEALTAELAHAAWRMFQAIEAHGGASRTSGGRDVLPETAPRAARVLVGTNRFADPTARVTEAPPHWSARPAAPFEALRRRSAAQPVAALLLPFGAPASARAAVAFATELLRCAGIEPAVAEASATPAQAEAALARHADARIVVCCGEDEADGPFLRGVLAALAGRADPPLLYATGRPLAGSETWGPIGFLHHDLDVARTLEGILDRLQQRASS